MTLKRLGRISNTIHDKSKGGWECASCACVKVCVCECVLQKCFHCDITLFLGALPSTRVKDPKKGWSCSFVQNKSLGKVENHNSREGRGTSEMIKNRKEEESGFTLNGHGPQIKPQHNKGRLTESGVWRLPDGKQHLWRKRMEKNPLLILSRNFIVAELEPECV